MNTSITYYSSNETFSKNIDLTLLIPAKNEAITIGEFVDWCKQGLSEANINGQILIVDSSTDQTKDIALEHGAEVLAVPARGLGRAYIDAIPYVKGKYIIMGDADLTYDTRLLKPFLQKFNEGYEFVMGSRFKGSIESGAMPALHQYFGTPLTTWILNLVYKSNFSDIHCGMRGITLNALQRINLKSQSWQYASEMIIKAIHLDLKRTEVPVVFHKDRAGRLSHHKRTGWYAPWMAGWINLKAIFTFGADFFLYKTGIFLTFLGFLGMTFLFNGPISIGKINFQLHWMLFFVILAIAGFQFFCMSLLAKTLYDVEMKKLPVWRKILSFNIAFPATILLSLFGIFNVIPLISNYINLNFHLPSTITLSSYHAVGGFGIILISIIYFTSSLLFNAILLSHHSTSKIDNL